MRKVLLLGNGINRVDNNYSWNDLMQDLLSYAQMQGAISIDNKPFPMLYEEIYLRWSQVDDRHERDIKHEISRLTRNIRSNDLHRLALRLDLDEIMTTNYDHNLESVTAGGIKGAELVPPIKGSKYSLMRKRKAGRKLVWHIHGETSAPGTILLGYEQYAGYLQTIRNYMIQGMNYTDLKLEPLTKRLREGDTRILAWVDHFFLSDVYILGLTMDFVEIHLWWLLDFRARLCKDARHHIHNKITYIYPAQDTPWIKPRIDLLCACGVHCIALPLVKGNWKAMYRMAMEMVERA